MVLVHDGDAVGAFDVAEGRADGFDEAPLWGLGGGGVVFAEEVGEDFGIGGGFKFVAFRDELAFERLVVLDHAIVHEGEAAGLV